MKVQIYALSTCAWCKKTKKFFEDNEIEYDAYDVDLIYGEEKDEIKTEVAKHNPRLSYPTTVIDDGEKVVVGFDEDKLKEALGV